MIKEVNVVGGGLAGVEAAYQLIKEGVPVHLYEMRPVKKTDVHKTSDFAELVCSNSLRADGLKNAVGVLKQEMTMNDSLIIKMARDHAVPAGGSLAVDREGFSHAVTEFIENHPLVTVHREEVTKIPEGPTIIASGPLTSDALAKEIMNLMGNQDYFYFYDAAAPIVTKESIDFNKAFYKSRYDKGDGEYINCPMNKEEYYNFYNALVSAERVPLKAFEEEKIFDACMPVERIAMTGEKTLVFGPLKPKGLTNPKTDKMDYAVVQLRQDDKDGRLYNLVGFQTNLKWGEQKRIFSMIPGLENADFVRYGVMHRNTFINSTELLDKTLKLKNSENIYFGGQITGSEGYVSSIATGMMAAINIAHKLEGKAPFILDDRSAIGAMVKYITEEKKNFQPMGPNFGIIRGLDGERIRDKKERYMRISQIALDYLDSKLGEI